MLLFKLPFSMPVLFKLPSKAAPTLFKLIRDLFWEGSREEGGMYNRNLEKLNFQLRNSAVLAE